MISYRPVFKILCIVFCILSPISCGETVSNPPACGDSITIPATPAVPALGGFPSLTNKTNITLFGTKSPDTSITISKAGVVKAVVGLDCFTTWAADVLLDDGTNNLEILSVDRTRVQSSSISISITKQTLSPPPPSSKIPGRLLCDVNGDSYDDVVVGSYENDAGGNNAGRAFIYYGSASGPDTIADVVLTGEAISDRFGLSVACAGDVNKDGLSDIIVGAFLNDGGGEDTGRAYIFFGGSSLVNKGAKDANVILTGQLTDDRFGTFVSAAGDVNGDGYDDVIVGAYSNDSGGADAGRAYIFYGGSNMANLPDVLPDVVLTGEATGDQFGIRVAWAGDVNGDTYDDVIVGADGADVGTSIINTGKAYIFFGGPYMAGQNASQADVILEGGTQDEVFASVARAGNLNGDAYDDVVVGASAYTAGSGLEICNDFVDNDNDGLVDRRDSNCYRGRVYVFLGGPTLTGTISANSANFILEKPVGADGFGFSVTAAGDVDGDGFGDLLVGAFLADRFTPINLNETNCNDSVDNDSDNLIDYDDSDCLIEDQGRAYLYFGGNPFRITQIVTSPNVTFLGEASPGVSPNFIPTSGQFGFALSGARKLNNDSFSDIVIGAYLHDTGITGPATDVGRVYIFSGRARASFSSSIQAVDACQTASTDHCLTGSESGPFGPDNGFGISVQ